MEYRKFKDKYIIRLEKGEEIIKSLTELCEKEDIKLGRVTGIGATNKAKIGLFDVENKEYHSTELKGDMEITNLSGNITRKGEEVYLHLHITLCDENNRALGGHLNFAFISATCELIVDVIEGYVDREFNEEVGLNILKF